MKLGFSFAFTLLFSFAARAELPPQLPAYGFSENQIDVVYDTQVYTDLVSLVGTAKKSIRIDFFLFSGPCADQILATLIEKQKQGVDVRVILDRKLLRFVISYPERLEMVMKLRKEKIPLAYSDLISISKPSLGDTHTIDHNKLVVVDEARAMIGSSNLGSMFSSYHDLMMKVEGPVAIDLAEEFDLDWYNSTHVGHEIIPTEIDSASLFHGKTNATTSWARVISTGVGRANSRTALLEVLDSAQKSIDVQMHEFSDWQLTNRLIAAKEWGVSVRVLLDPWDLGKLSPLLAILPHGIANVPTVDALLKAGIEVRTFHLGSTYKVAHMKAAIIDGNTLFAGSTNWTPPGFSTVIETDLEVHGGKAPGEAEAMFEHDWSQRSDPASKPTDEDWRLYSIYQKLSGG